MKGKITKIILEDKFPLKAAIVSAIFGALLVGGITMAAELAYGWVLVSGVAAELLSAWVGVRLAWTIQEKFEETSEEK